MKVRVVVMRYNTEAVAIDVCGWTTCADIAKIEKPEIVTRAEDVGGYDENEI
jgi:hypothetical protein